MNRYNNPPPAFLPLLYRRPTARASLRGSEKHGGLTGDVRFYQTERGVLTVAELVGLPEQAGQGVACNRSPIFGFHIHEGGNCGGGGENAFSEAGSHYNPEGCPHPYHAGDMPPLFGANGYAFSAFLTDRFTVEEIVGRTVIVHSAPDDFTTQPGGNAGERIACGVIVR